MGVPGSSAPPDAGEVFKKFVKDQCKICNFLKNFQGNFGIFQNFIEFLAKILTKLEKYAFVWDLGAENPDTSEIIEI